MPLSDGQAKDLLTELRERFDRAQQFDSENRRLSQEDLRFATVPGEQWDSITRKERGKERPMYEFNKLRVLGKRVINDMRSNRPQGKVRAFEDSDKDTAEVFEGLIRNIWNVSDGDTIIDWAAEYQVFAGVAGWRVNTKYVDDTAFDQDIVIEPILNPYCLHVDPACQDVLKRDAEYWILESKISKSAYERKYPKRKVVDWEGTSFETNDWIDDDTVRIAEYWWKEPKTVELALLSDGSSVDLSEVSPDELAAKGLSVVRQRTCKTHQIKQAICSGESLLEGPNDWAGRHFPFVQVHGEYVVVDGKARWYGLTRWAKDAQRAYNVTRTAMVESIALAPQFKYWATPKQVEGVMGLINEAHKKLYPVMPYNPDPQAPGPPTATGGPNISPALVSESQFASDDLKAITGIFDASLGNRSNEQTGVAIRARQSEGQIATYNYMDNLAKGIRRTWEILIDLIPRIYDTTRTVRILGQDGAEKYAAINHPDPVTGRVINDLSRGKYDVAITVGPSYTTQRMEAVEAYTQIGQSQPALYQVAGDIIFRNMDLPGADQIAERMKAMLPPAIQQTIKDGKPLPPEVQQAMAQAQQMMQQVEQHGMLVQRASQEVEQKSAEIDKQMSDLAVKRAQFDADVAKQLAAITAKEAELVLKDAQSQSVELDAERKNLSAEIQQVVNAIHHQANDYMSNAASLIAQMQQTAQPMVNVVEQPKPRIRRIKRVNGDYIPEYEDQVTQ